jgi:hypothetical protein
MNAAYLVSRIWRLSYSQDGIAVTDDLNPDPAFADRLPLYR